MTPWLDDGDVRVFLGDCVEVMAAMPAESVDAVVCDPPYGLEFMGKEWDSFSDVDLVTRSGHDTASSGAGITKPGFSPLGKNGTPAFGGNNRSYECVRCGRRDAFRKEGTCEGGAHDWRQINPNGNAAMRAFEQWCETWAREALRVLKPGGHLLAFGGTRTFHRLTCGIEDAGFEVRDCLSYLYGSGFPKSLDVSKAIDKAAGAERTAGARKWSGGARSGGIVRDDVSEVTTTRTIYDAPATNAAREWQGWGTALKPGWEPCVVARKPLAGTVAENVQRYGTGALNVDGCRIPHGDDVNMDAVQRQKAGPSEVSVGWVQSGHEQPTYNPQGRWPANVALDEDAAAMLDAQSGERPSGIAVQRNGGGGKIFGSDNRRGDTADAGYMDGGGASRFYYTAKASRADRNTSGATNTHPTVKPTDLMRWLVRLVTPPGGVLLDPFAGSGSTLVAARAEGFRAIGIEREQEYADIIAARLSQLSLFTEGME